MERDSLAQTACRWVYSVIIVQIAEDHLFWFITNTASRGVGIGGIVGKIVKEPASDANKNRGKLTLSQSQ